MERDKLKALAKKAFPDRPGEPHCDEPKYSWNEVNKFTRQAMLLAYDWLEGDRNTKTTNDAEEIQP